MLVLNIISITFTLSHSHSFPMSFSNTLSNFHSWKHDYIYFQNSNIKKILTIFANTLKYTFKHTSKYIRPFQIKFQRFSHTLSNILSHILSILLTCIFSHLGSLKYTFRNIFQHNFKLASKYLNNLET